MMKLARILREVVGTADRTLVAGEWARSRACVAASFGNVVGFVVLQVFPSPTP